MDRPPEGLLVGRHYDLGQYAWGTGADLRCDFWSSNFTPGPAGETWFSILDGVERTFDSHWNGGNRGGFANQEFDHACGRAISSIPGRPEYETAFLEAQRVFAEQLPTIPLFSYIQQAATRPDMCGFIVDPTGGTYWNIEEFDYGEGCEE